MKIHETTISNPPDKKETKQPQQKDNATSSFAPPEPESKATEVINEVEVSNSSEFLNLKAAVTTLIAPTVQEEKKAAQQTAMAGMPLSMQKKVQEKQSL